MATLTVTNNTSLTLGSTSYAVNRSYTVECEWADKRALTVPNSEVSLLTIGTPATSGQVPNIVFFMLKCRDTTTGLRIRFIDTGNDAVDFKVDAGEHIVWHDNKLEVNTTGATFTAYVTLDTIFVNGDGATTDIEYLVCSRKIT